MNADRTDGPILARCAATSNDISEGSDRVPTDKTEDDDSLYLLLCSETGVEVTGGATLFFLVFSIG